MSSAGGDSLPLLSHFCRKTVAVIVVTCALTLSHKATLPDRTSPCRENRLRSLAAFRAESKTNRRPPEPVSVQWRHPLPSAYKLVFATPLCPCALYTCFSFPISFKTPFTTHTFIRPRILISVFFRALLRQKHISIKYIDHNSSPICMGL